MNAIWLGNVGLMTLSRVQLPTCPIWNLTPLSCPWGPLVPLQGPHLAWVREACLHKIVHKGHLHCFFARGPKKAHKLFNITFWPPPKTPHLGPPEKVYVPHFLGKDTENPNGPFSTTKSLVYCFFLPLFALMSCGWCNSSLLWGILTNLIWEAWGRASTWLNWSLSPQVSHCFWGKLFYLQVELFYLQVELFCLQSLRALIRRTLLL